jgi:hypothetical protein
MIRAVKAGQPSSGAAQAATWASVRRAGAVPLENPVAVGLRGQRHREQARGAQQPAEGVPRVARHDERAHQRAAHAGQGCEWPAVGRPRRLAQEGTMSRGEEGVQQHGQRDEDDDRPGDAGVHVSLPGAWGPAAVTVVPSPDRDPRLTVPPTASSRSRMFSRPAPPPSARTCARSKPVPSSATTSRHRRPSPPSRTVTVPAPECFAGVLDRLHAAEVQRRLDRGRQPTQALGLDDDRDRAGPHRGPQGRLQTIVGQHARVDPPGQGGQGLDRHTGRARPAWPARRWRVPGSERRSSGPVGGSLSGPPGAAGHRRGCHARVDAARRPASR